MRRKKKCGRSTRICLGKAEGYGNLISCTCKSNGGVSNRVTIGCHSNDDNTDDISNFDNCDNSSFYNDNNNSIIGSRLFEFNLK